MSCLRWDSNPRHSYTYTRGREPGNRGYILHNLEIEATAWPQTVFPHLSPIPLALPSSSLYPGTWHDSGLGHGLPVEPDQHHPWQPSQSGETFLCSGPDRGHPRALHSLLRVCRLLLSHVPRVSEGAQDPWRIFSPFLMTVHMLCLHFCLCVELWYLFWCLWYCFLVFSCIIIIAKFLFVLHLYKRHEIIMLNKEFPCLVNTPYLVSLGSRPPPFRARFNYA